MTERANLKESDIQELESNVRGEIIRPGGESYNTARKVFNSAIDRFPALIVRCAEVADVMKAVDFAHANNLPVAVRGGAHNVSGNAVCDGGIVIDLQPMKGIRVDPDGRTARAQGGVTWGELDRETQTHGLATPGGTFSGTGIAGLTLGGGMGYLSGQYGLACDNLLSVDMVTADGKAITASLTQNQDLFWGVRGGGGNFGIVTTFEYQLHPIGLSLAGIVFHPATKAKEVLRFYRDYARNVPDELTAHALLLTMPGSGPVVGIIVCYVGSGKEAEDAVRPVREFGSPLVDLIRPMSYCEVQSMNALGQPGRRHRWKSNFLQEVSDDVIDTLITHFASVTSPQSVVLIEQIHGAVNRVGQDATAFSHRSARYNLTALSTWTDPSESERHSEWTREFSEAVQPLSTGGVYVNYMGQEGEERVKAAYAPATYEKLVALKNRYDPGNFFCLNQNIKPTA